MQELKDYVVIMVGVATIVSLGVSLYFQSKSFKLQKSKENENELFKLKLEAYGKILSELNILQNNIHENIIIATNRTNTKEQLDKMADYIDHEVDKFENLVILNSLYFSEEIADCLEDIFICLYEDTDDISIKDADVHYDKLLDLANNLNDTIREELQLDKLNNNLYRRNGGVN